VSMLVTADDDDAAVVAVGVPERCHRPFCGSSLLEGANGAETSWPTEMSEIAILRLSMFSFPRRSEARPRESPDRSEVFAWTTLIPLTVCLWRHSPCFLIYGIS